MSLPDLILVHGGAHAADCWDLTVAELGRQEPELRVVAVDLPGRRGKPGNLATATIAEWVDSVVADIEAAGSREVVIVGHSMAGKTVPGVVAKLGSIRTREMILITATVPPQNAASLDSLAGPIAWFARRVVKDGEPRRLPKPLARYVFCNGMSPQQRTFTLSRLCPETTRILAECVDRSDLPADVPRTWILTTQDRAISVRTQRESIAALGGVQHEIEIPACHDVMISHPHRLAQILIERCRAHSAHCGGKELA